LPGHVADAGAGDDLQAAFDGVEEHVSEAEAGGVVIAVDRQLGELCPCGTAFEEYLERVAVQVGTAVLFEISDADLDRVGIEQAPLFHRLETAGAGSLGNE
jgi:hypothetical protein